MSSRSSARSARASFAPAVEVLESRQLLSVLRPDHVVIVIEQDRASDALGNSNFPFLNALAETGLSYGNAHGVAHPSLPNTLALFSGSTQGVTDNGRNYSFGGPNLARSLFDAGLTFASYVENLPADGSQVTQAGDAQYPDLYTRNLNAVAQFTDAGTLADGSPRPNAAVNRTFDAFKAVAATGDYSALPTVSFVVPNNLHSTHGSNEAYPWAGSSDEENNDLLRGWADAWLRDHLDPYLQWAKAHNSLLIVTQDEERWVGGTAQTVTTVVNGDPRLFVRGTNPNPVNHYNLLRTVLDMYGLPPINHAATAAPLDTDAQGRLTPHAAPVMVATTTALASSANPAAYGQAVTFTATVTAASGSGIPAGTVTFTDGSTVLGTAPLDATGRATVTTSSLSAGSHLVTATYGGSDAFAASSSPVLTQEVTPAPAPAPAATTIALTSNLNPAAAGKLITFTARVAPSLPGSDAPKGTVTFKDGSTVLGVVPLNASGSAGVSTNVLAVGSHGITAVYGGSAAFQPSTSAVLAQRVAAPTSAPANDHFGNRITLSGPSATAYGTNLNATKQFGEPRHAGNKGGRSVWWAWTAPGSGTVTVDTLGSNFNTLLAVYTGTSVWALRALASNDNAAGSAVGASRLTFSATAGRQYQIAVDGYRGAAGALTLRLNLAAPVVAAATSSGPSSAPALRQARPVTKEVLG